MSLRLNFELEAHFLKQISQFELASMGNRLQQRAIELEQKIKGNFEKHILQPPDPNQVHDAVLKLLRGGSLNRWEFNLVAGAINLPIEEQGGRRLLDTPLVDKILNYFREQYELKKLSMLGWIRLLGAYFSITPDRSNPKAFENLENIRLFLNETHLYYFLKKKFEPGFSITLRNHTNLLSDDDPCQRYAKRVLQGDRTEINELQKNLPIKADSWFYYRLNMSVIQLIIDIRSDNDFKKNIPQLLRYLGDPESKDIKIFGEYRDNAIRLALKRYYDCADKSRNKELCDYVIHPDVWRSPKLRDTNIMSKWNSVDKKIWEMVRGWVNRENLRLFFELLSKRLNADKGRFKFWIQYIEQIDNTRFVFGKATIETKDIELKSLLKMEMEVSSFLDTADREVDAFIIQIRGHTFVEFSQTGNAAFLYRKENIPFIINSKRLTHEQLGRGGNHLYRFRHMGGNWQQKLKNRLMEEFHIFPDPN